MTFPTIPIFSHLEKLPWFRDLTYKTKGAILRFLKTLLAMIVGAVLAAAVAGNLLPPEYAQYQFAIALFVVPLLTAADKYIREWKIEEEYKEEGEVPLVDDVSLEDVPEEELPEAIEQLPTEPAPVEDVPVTETPADAEPDRE